ncbi:uncharacterized protein [Dermacentor albipictus]|uniref:uncharacterized protein n=1 Tax=Dermacentor albipictus TaxID=60249 RepID=UPI0038FCBF31
MADAVREAMKMADFFRGAAKMADVFQEAAQMIDIFREAPPGPAMKHRMQRTLISTVVHAIETLSSTSAGQPSASVLTVSTLEAKRDLQVPVVVNDVAMQLFVDTGASVSLMTAEDFGKHFGRQHRLSKTVVDLRNFSRQRIDIQGLFQASVQFLQRSCSVTFHVTSTGTSLLGLDAIQRLGIQIDGTSLTCCLATLPPVQSPTGVPPGFDHLFSGELGLVKNFVHRMHRRQGMKPVSSKLRRLPLALRDQVTNELRRLEDCDVIERVEASEWVSPLVVVLKKDGAIRLCVDLREPNKAIVIDGGVSSIPVALVPSNGGFIRLNNPQAVQAELQAMTSHFQLISDVRQFGREWNLSLPVHFSVGTVGVLAIVQEAANQMDAVVPVVPIILPMSAQLKPKLAAYVEETMRLTMQTARLELTKYRYSR